MSPAHQLVANLSEKFKRLQKPKNFAPLHKTEPGFRKKCDNLIDNKFTTSKRTTHPIDQTIRLVDWSYLLMPAANIVCINFTSVRISLTSEKSEPRVC